MNQEPANRFGWTNGTVESSVEGHIHAPYDTPEMNYEDWLRGEVIQTFRAENPISADRFPDPIPTTANSNHVFGYLGFGGLGPCLGTAPMFDGKEPSRSPIQRDRGMGKPSCCMPPALPMSERCSQSVMKC